MRYQIKVSLNHVNRIRAHFSGDFVSLRAQAIDYAYATWCIDNNRNPFSDWVDWLDSLERDGELYIIPIDLSDFGIEAVTP